MWNHFLWSHFIFLEYFTFCDVIRNIETSRTKFKMSGGELLTLPTQQSKEENAQSFFHIFTVFSICVNLRWYDYDSIAAVLISQMSQLAIQSMYCKAYFLHVNMSRLQDGLSKMISFEYHLREGKSRYQQMLLFLIARGTVYRQGQTLYPSVKYLYCVIYW